MSRTPVFFHVDLDAFYASVEQLDFPDLAGKPVIVGASPGHRGVVAACSYEARAYGVHSAMPISEAARRCPHAEFRPVRMTRYQEMSEQVMAVFERYSPELQQISVDEAFLNMTGTERLFGPPVETARRLKGEVRDALGLVISVGIGPSRYIAKLASARGKPDGLYEVSPGGEAAFVASLPLEKLWGVGGKTLRRLKDFGITTVEELRAQEPAELYALFGRAAGDYLHAVSRGIDPGIYAGEAQSHSVSNETTFGHDVSDREIIESTILELCHGVVFRLLRHGLVSKTATLKLRFSDFTTTTVRRTLSAPVASTEQFYRLALTMLEEKWNGRREIRLVGVGVAQVEGKEPARQGELFGEREEKRRRVEEAALDVNARFGKTGLTRARLLRPGHEEAADDDPGADEAAGSDRHRR
jgi:DNA polymerase-4